MRNEKARLTQASAALVAIDFQERLLPAVFGREALIQNGVRLIKGAQILGVPVLATEQYRKGLGPTVPEIAGAISGFAPIQKLAFSACGAQDFVGALQAKKVSAAILCGVETHVCVAQTCLDLLESGLEVFVVADAVSSRTPENHRIGLDRMKGAGAVIVSTEMALFELLGEAGTDQFKQVLALVK